MIKTKTATGTAPVGPHPRHVLFVSPSTEFFVSHRLVLARAVIAAGHRATLLSPPSPATATVRAAGVAWEPLPGHRGRVRLHADLATLGALVRAYRRLRPDIVHHITLKTVLSGTWAARRAGVPRVVNAISGLGFAFTGHRPLLRSAAIAAFRLLLRHPDMTVIVQNEEDRALIEAQRMAPAGSLVLIPGSGVDLALLRPRDRSALAPTVVQVSRMLKDKGVPEFIEAARQLKPHWPHVRFVLVGDVDPVNPSSLTRAELEAATSSGAVEWWGFRADIDRVLAEATQFVLPSWREGLPKSLIEAAAAGLPLVTTNTSGCAEVVRHEVNGLLVPVADPAALAGAIERLLADPDLGHRLGSAARRSAEQRFGVEAIVSQQLALYGLAVGQPEPARPLARVEPE